VVAPGSFVVGRPVTQLQAPWAMLVCLALLGAACGGAGPASPARATPTGGAVRPGSQTPAATGTPSSPSPAAATPRETATTEQATADLGRVQLQLVEFASGFEDPLYLTHSGDGSGRVYVVEQGGRILVVERTGTVQGAAFLDIAERVSAGGERGLLGLAFHPAYARNGRLFVNYTDRNGDTVVSEFRGTATRADPGSERVLLQIDQPYANHNGGWIGFGPDGYLYIATGDGGSGGDPHNNGQRRDTLLGKLLRIDVDRGSPYAIPADNPFARDGGARGEIWAYGLRNPWRVSFDRRTGNVFLGDVGQGRFEELDFQPAARSGLNYGWNIMEGPECFRQETCDRNGLVLPVFAYGRDQGIVITGGYVYRGSRFPLLAGIYLFGDYGSGRIWAAAATDAARGRVDPVPMLESALSLSSFGEDEAGELYAIDLTGGGVYRVQARAR
jgi:glucose/arabinose dehydrogenase